MTITQYIPSFVAGVDPRVSSVASTDQLLSLDWVGSYRLDPAFFRFSLASYGDRVLLMAEVDEGFARFVIGSLDQLPGAVLPGSRLPRWTPRRRALVDAIGGALSVGKITLPTHCFACGAYLRGGATEHASGCSVLALIRRGFETRAPRIRSAGAGDAD